MKNKKIKKIKDNNIGDNGKQAIEEALKMNSTLTELNLY